MLAVDELDLAFLSVTERIESHGLGLQQLVSRSLSPCRPWATGWRRVSRSPWRSPAMTSSSAIGEGARLRELLISAGRDAGFEPRVTLESNESERIRRLVARGSA